MNEQRARELFLEHHRGSLPAHEASELHALLATHPTLQREFDELAATLNALDTMPITTPTARLRRHVLAAIEAEKSATQLTPQLLPAFSVVPAPRPATNRPWFWITRLALAGSLLAAGYLIGTRQLPSDEIPPTVAAKERSSREEIVELRRQVEAMNEIVSQSFPPPSQRPTSDRLKAVLASATLENPNDRVIKELIGSLTLDPSINVRLTALEALYPHAAQDVVRAGVLTALPREQSPLVQVAMIDFLVAARDHAAAPALDEIFRSDTADRNVRAAAMRGLNQL